MTIATDKTEIYATLATLRDAIQTQIAYEYHDTDAQERRFQDLTVAELLEMLAYMFGKD